MGQQVLFVDYVNRHTLYLIMCDGGSRYYNLARFLCDDTVAQALLEQDVFVDGDGGLSWPSGLSVSAHDVALDSVPAPAIADATDI